MSNNLHLNSDVGLVKGVGEKKKARLNHMKIFTVGDLLNHTPYKYKDRRFVKQIVKCSENDFVLVSGKLNKVQFRSVYGNRNIVECYFSDESSVFSVSFFNKPFIKQNLIPGTYYSIFGQIKIRNGYKYFNNPEICVLNSEKDYRGIAPVYRCTNGLTNNDFIKWIKYCLEQNILDFEWIDKDIIDSNKICSLKFAYYGIHFPKDKKHYQSAKYRMIYEQLLLYQLALQINKRRNLEESEDSAIPNIDIRPFIQGLPFELTAGQLKCILDIENDLIAKKPMNRLIQGDVGCGKTVVAEAAIYKCAMSKHQSAMMAPTEILARQHYNRLKKELQEYNIRVELLVSGMKVATRNQILQDLSNGSIDVIIGTHALLQDDVIFKSLTLVITDEQHRFGVNQRKHLVQKGRAVNICVMSATPIPRSLAATVYGDMDFSIIRNKPIDRKAIITRAFNPDSRERAYISAEKEIDNGHQVYVVAPSIDINDDDISSVEQLYEELRIKYKGKRLALLHGRMSKEEKENIMNKFSNGDIDILVATVVIEVGIDVPNATTIIIENSERFGLAQLHQLRGRVGRSNLQSYCYIINYSKSDNAELRAKSLVDISDGFEISEADFRLRGPGDITGTMQSGNYSNNIISLCSYTDILEAAVRDAAILIKNPGGTDISFVKEYMNKVGFTDNSNII